jgi:hypothetical protein
MAIAGFLRPDKGSIRFGEREVVRLAPHKREIGMVFQNYALFPHMDVARNVGFPLRLRHVPATEIARRVEAVLEMFQLGGYGGRAHRPALRRPAPARRARPCHRLRAAHHPDGRAALGARQAVARAHADRAAPAPRSPWHHHRLCHARPARGADHVGPHRGARSRADCPDRYAARDLRPSRQPLRRGVHRRILVSRCRCRGWHLPRRRYRHPGAEASRSGRGDA